MQYKKCLLTTVILLVILSTFFISAQAEESVFNSISLHFDVPDIPTLTECDLTISVYDGYDAAWLSTGVHSFVLVWTDGTATTHFTVAKNTTDDKKTENTKTEDTEIVDTAPKTGDKNYPVFWKIMFTFSIMSLGLIAVTGRRKRKDI